MDEINSRVVRASDSQLSWIRYEAMLSKVMKKMEKKKFHGFFHTWRYMPCVYVHLSFVIQEQIIFYKIGIQMQHRTVLYSGVL